jgi:GH24 family phage-related lysozyme (muramidase)
MTYAYVRAAVEHAVRQGKLSPQQLAAFSLLDEKLSPELKGQFTELWRAEGSPAAAPERLPAPLWLAPALRLIKEFEGCRLVAYPDPGTGGVPWTVGWGTTRLIDRPVRQGDTITQQFADELLLNEVENLFAPGLFTLLPLAKRWRPEQQAALISFAYNVGLGAVEESTLRKRLLAGEDPATVVREELPRWNKGDGGKVLAGLERRRDAEVALFCGGQALAPQPAKLTPASPFTARLTPHIQLGEFALFQEERRFDHQHQLDTAAELAAFMERCRTQFGGKPVVITSGYRPPAINRSVGGASSSEHLYNAPSVGAVDFYIQGASIQAVQDWCDKQWPYSLGYGAPKGFVHLGIRQGRPRVRWDY